jgi:hypothetical protein
MTKVNEVDRWTGGCRRARSLTKTAPVGGHRQISPFGIATRFSPALSKTPVRLRREKESAPEIFFATPRDDTSCVGTGKITPKGTR